MTVTTRGSDTRANNFHSADRLFGDGLAAIERREALASCDIRKMLASEAGAAATPPTSPRPAPQITRLPAPVSRRGGKSSKRTFLAPEAVKDHIRAALPGPEGLLSLLGLGKVASSGGAKIVMCCPVHADSTPSFGIDVVGGRVVYHCFGCEIGGDVFGLIAIGKGLDVKTQFPAVLDAAARIAGYGSADAVRQMLTTRGGAR